MATQRTVVHNKGIRFLKRPVAPGGGPVPLILATTRLREGIKSRVQGQPWLHTNTTSQKQNKTKNLPRVREMAQWLLVLVALPEDPRLVPSTHAGQFTAA